MSKSTTKQCSVEGCEKPHYGKGYCDLHYARLWRTGSVEDKVFPVTRRDELGRKRCSMCKEWKFEDAFGVANANKDRLQNYCKVCASIQHRSVKYGVSGSMFQQMLQDQNNACGICKETFPNTSSAHVDHDHGCCPDKKSCGDCVRQLLCNGCNTGIGHFRDNPAALRAAADYLDSYIKR